MEEKFFVMLEDGRKVPATSITRLKVEGTDIIYQYYSIDDGNDSVSILASRIVVENGQEIFKDLENEEERQVAYELFSETYKKIKSANVANAA